MRYLESQAILRGACLEERPDGNGKRKPFLLFPPGEAHSNAKGN